MSKGEHLGELEELILLTVGSLQDEQMTSTLMKQMVTLTIK